MHHPIIHCELDNARKNTTKEQQNTTFSAKTSHSVSVLSTYRQEATKRCGFRFRKSEARPLLAQAGFGPGIGSDPR
jgi:hypothetical protein